MSVRVVLAMVIVATGCSLERGNAPNPGSTSSSGERTTASAAATTMRAEFASSELGAAGCRPPSPFADSEVFGTAGTAQLHGLVIGSWPLRAGRDVKIVWRMTGAGDLGATATGPSGEEATLTFGPTPHGGSTYHRPGEEWGTGWRFPSPGCWHLRLERDDSQGDVWFLVEP